VTLATEDVLGTIGIWLLVAGGLAIVVELALVAIWGLALGRRARALSERIESERSQMRADVETLRQAIEEMKVLWRPYRRVLRWLRHPLVIALLSSYRRRMAAR
jgi:hypothetical protein